MPDCTAIQTFQYHYAMADYYLYASKTIRAEDCDMVGYYLSMHKQHAEMMREAEKEVINDSL